MTATAAVTAASAWLQESSAVQTQSMVCMLQRGDGFPPYVLPQEAVIGTKVFGCSKSLFKQ